MEAVSFGGLGWDESEMGVRWQWGGVKTKDTFWLLVAASNDSADLTAQTGCCFSLAAQQDQWEWQAGRGCAPAPSRQLGQGHLQGAGGEERMGGRWGLPLGVEFSSFWATFDNYTSSAPSSRRKSSWHFLAALFCRRRQNGDSLLFIYLFILVELWAPQHRGAAIDQACGFCAEGNNVAGL